VVELPLVPFLYSDRLLRSRRRSGVGRHATVAKGPRIARDHWRAIAARAEHEGLRCVARDLGGSHEIVRAIYQRVRDEAVPTEDPPARLALPHRR
jgi:hypothetical protein